MRTFRWAFAVLAAALSVASAAADDAGWHLEKDQDGIQIYSRAVDGWSIHEMRSTTHIAGRLSSVVAVITDVDAMHELVDVVAESKITQRDSDTRYQIYSLMKMPWPISNRDILNQREIKQDASTLTVTITDTATQDVIPLKKDLVRILKSRQVWTLTPTADGGVQVENRLLSDPNGPIPSSVINAMSVGTPFKTMTQLKALVQRPQYANAKPGFIKDAPGHS
jgi:hypothetical protein